MSNLDTSKLVKPNLLELKAGVYDRVNLIEKTQQEINIINEEIKKIESQSPVEEVKPKEEKQEKEVKDNK